VRFVSYPPQGYGPQGFQPYGTPPPGYPPYGYGYGRPSTALAYVTAIVFLVCGGLALMAAIVSWDGTTDSVAIVLSVIGFAFKPDNRTNFDFAIVITMIVACTTLLFGALMFARLEFVRWILAVLGALVTAYYTYAIIRILSNDAGEFVAVALIAWVVWLTGTVLAVLPATGRAMRRRQPAYPPAGY
jgi:hypothetical protein